MFNKNSTKPKIKKPILQRFWVKLLIVIMVLGVFGSVFGSETGTMDNLSESEYSLVSKEYSKLSKSEKASLLSLKTKLSKDKLGIKLSDSEKSTLEKNLSDYSKEQSSRNEFSKARAIAEAELLEISRPVFNNYRASTVEITDTKTDPIEISTQTDKHSDSDILYHVERVIDGDTILIKINGKEERIRLIGIDAPESVHPDETKNTHCGTIASEFTKSRLEGKQVTIEKDIQERDKYGRLLAYVYLDGVMFNKTLVEEGMAQVSTYPPNVKYADEFLELQRHARENNIGLWAEDCSTENSETPAVTSNPSEALYIGNLNSHKFHHPNCKAVKKMKSYNKKEFFSREEAINSGYIPCKICNP